MDMTRGNVYPYPLLDVCAEVPVATNDYFKNHHFDIPRSKDRKQTSRAFKLAHPDETARGTRGVRQHYRVDQSRIGDLEKLE